jgi:hypothetical protein
MMRARALGAFLVSSMAVASLVHGSDEPAPGARQADVDRSSALSPADPGYAEAVALGHFLETHGRGFKIRLIGRSKFDLLLGERRSATYVTDHGNFAVLFFPPPDGAERVRITSEVRDGRYDYTFRTHQRGLQREERMVMDGPQRFVVHGSWFILVWDGATEEALKAAFADTTGGPTGSARGD